MAREENSVMSSLQQLYVEEERRRAERIRVAHCRKLEQDREVLQQQARESDAARRRSEAELALANQRRAEEQAEQQRLELERISAVERARAAAELNAKMVMLQSDQQQELARLAILRDRRVTRLEGQRGLLLSLLSTLMLGSIGLYFLVVRPSSIRQEELIAELSRNSSIERLAHEQERQRLAMRIAERDADATELERKLEETRHLAAARPEKTPTRFVQSPRPPSPVERPCVDENDPLCGNLSNR